jgi:iron-sulfur cluster insertion protein
MTIQLTDNAIHRITSLIQAEPNPEITLFRITVSGGGCAGFQYGFSFDSTAQEDDQVFDFQGVKVVVDSASLALLEGIQIDYVEELIGSSFQIKNPNASSSCGCGNSFSI